MRTICIYIFLLIGCFNITLAQGAKEGTIYNEFASATTGSNKIVTGPVEMQSKKAMYVSKIYNYFPEQLTNPELKKRRSLAQFGYIFPMCEFIKTGNYGKHSYGKPDRAEHNGCLYTRNGGFIDFSHVRAALDWTVYLTFKTLTEKDGFDLPYEGGTLQVKLKNTENMSLDDITVMAQKIAFERLVWHEVASWYYHWPNHLISEQQSAFTPEDIYSDFTGTIIGRNVALRLLNNPADISYSQVASEEIEKYISSLDPVNGKKETKIAYKLVDLTRQKRVPEAERNNDVWWESRIIFLDQAYVFKRYMDIGPQLEPWLVPAAEGSVCSSAAGPAMLEVPELTEKGESFYKYYQFVITPDKELFVSHGNGKHFHTSISRFATSDLPAVVEHVRKEMELILHPWFDKRNIVVPEEEKPVLSVK